MAWDNLDNFSPTCVTLIRTGCVLAWIVRILFPPRSYASFGCVLYIIILASLFLNQTSQNCGVFKANHSILFKSLI